MEAISETNFAIPFNGRRGEWEDRDKKAKVPPLSPREKPEPVSQKEEEVFHRGFGPKCPETFFSFVDSSKGEEEVERRECKAEQTRLRGSREGGRHSCLFSFSASAKHASDERERIERHHFPKKTDWHSPHPPPFLLLPPPSKPRVGRRRGIIQLRSFLSQIRQRGKSLSGAAFAEVIKHTIAPY